MPTTIALINCAPTRMTSIKNYVSNQKARRVEIIDLLSKSNTEHNLDLEICEYEFN